MKYRALFCYRAYRETIDMDVVILSIDSATSTIYLHVKQTEGTETANASFDLGAATMNYGNNAPYFQWGRKDPIVPSTGLTNANKPIYGTYTALNNMSTADIAVTIRTPYYFNSSNGNPSLELWNVGNEVTTYNVNPVIKSIYDPSPAGYHVPCPGACEGWNVAGRGYHQNISGLWGTYIYQLGPATGNVVFFPALGYRIDYSVIGSLSGFSIYWYSGPGATNIGLGYYMEGAGCGPRYSNGRSYAFNIHPVAEN